MLTRRCADPQRLFARTWHGSAVCARPSCPPLSNDVRVSDADDSGTDNGRREENGVLVNLPRARPQRASARRASARNGPARNGARPTSAAERPSRSVADESPATKPAAKQSSDRHRKPAAKAPAARGAKRVAKAPTDRASKPGTRAPVKAVRESAASSTARASLAERTSGRKPAGATKPARQAPRKRSRAGAVEEAAPRQGFESESDRSHDSVQPPGGIELVASAAELVGELAKAGVSTGERVLKDVLSRLPL
jgi:hypothetical protein